MAILLIPLMLIGLVDSLKRLAIFTFLANVTTLVGFIIMFFYICPNMPPIGTREAFGEIKNYPLFAATVIFSVEAIGTVSKIIKNYIY